MSGPPPESAYSFVSAGLFSSFVIVLLQLFSFCGWKSAGIIIRVSGVRPAVGHRLRRDDGGIQSLHRYAREFGIPGRPPPRQSPRRLAYRPGPIFRHDGLSTPVPHFFPSLHKGGDFT